MNAEHEALREEAQDLMLKRLVSILKEEDFEPATFKALYSAMLEEKSLELAARRAENAAKKQTDGETRTFSPEETVEGIRALLGKGGE